MTELSHRRKYNGRTQIFSALAGLLTAFFYVAGYQLDRFDSLDLTDQRFYFVWAAAAAACGIIIHLLYLSLDRAGRHPWMNPPVKSLKKWGCLRGTLILFVCWLPTLFSIFPGVFSYDAFDEWKQVHDWMITSHHPVAHVLLLGGLTEGFYLLTGSYNVGIAIYTVLQMLILAWALSLSIAFMAEFGVPRFWRILSMVFYALSPIVQLFSICATKDVFFTAAELLFFLSAIRFSVDRESAGNRKRMIYFGISALCTMIFRNNGVYIVLLTLAVLAVCCRKQWIKYPKNTVLFLLMLFLPYFLYIGPVYKALGVTPGGVEEMLSVPLQQMARVYRYDADSLSEEELAGLRRFVEQDALEQYRPTVADFVKKGFIREEFRKHPSDFFSLWVKLGIGHPLIYMNSFLINTVDAWYPHALIDGYRHADGRGSLFDYKVSIPGEERVYLRGLHNFYETISHDLEAQKKPFAFLLLSPGWYFLCTLLFFFYFWSRRKYKLFLPMWIFVFHMLTVLPGPMALVRYMLLFFFAFPLICAIGIFQGCFEREHKPEDL